MFFLSETEYLLSENCDFNHENEIPIFYGNLQKLQLGVD